MTELFGYISSYYAEISRKRQAKSFCNNDELAAERRQEKRIKDESFFFIFFLSFSSWMANLFSLIFLLSFYFIADFPMKHKISVEMSLGICLTTSIANNECFINFVNFCSSDESLKTFFIVFFFKRINSSTILRLRTSQLEFLINFIKRKINNSKMRLGKLRTIHPRYFFCSKPHNEWRDYGWKVIFYSLDNIGYDNAENSYWKLILKLVDRA